MTLDAFEIPDDPAALATWVERQLTGLNLAAVASELTAVHGPADSGGSVRDVLGDNLHRVLQSGLGTVPAKDVQKLLVEPALLLEMHGIISAQGGEYWDRIGRSLPEVDAHVERGRRQLKQFLANEAPTTSSIRSAVPRGARVSWYRRPMFVSLATAASVLLVVFLWQLSAPKPLGVRWGWNRPESMAANATPSHYLNGLADAADEWFNKRPDHAADLARRLNEFRQGCSTLILAQHQPLAAKDREWLVEKCRAWAAKLDKHLTDLEAGQEPLKVRAEADETVQRLIQALRDRAKTAVV